MVLRESLFSNIDIIDIRKNKLKEDPSLMGEYGCWGSFDGAKRSDIFHLLDLCRFGHINLLFYPPSMFGILKKIQARLNLVYPTPKGYLAFMTSGSTGKLKIVVHEMSSLMHSARKIQEKYPAIIGGTSYAAFPNNYMAGVLNNLFVPLVSSGKIIFDDTFDFSTAHRIPKIFNDHSVTWSWMSPTMISAVTNVSQKSGILEFTELILSATAPLSSSLRTRSMQHLGTRVLNTYGLTELLFVSGEDKPDNEVSIGTPFQGVDVEIIDEVIAVTSDTKFSGILEIDLFGNKVTVKNGNLDPEIFRTNDLGRQSHNGITLEGRSDDIVKVNGFMVSLSLIEKVCNSLPNIVDSCARVNYSLDHTFIELFVELNDAKNFSAKSLKDFLFRNLPDGHKPNHVYPAKLPRLYSGKIDRQALRKQGRVTD